MFSRFVAALLVALTLAVAAAPAAAQSLAIGLAADVTSIDPHYHVIGPNQNVAEHVFDTLVHRDPRQKLIPGLAASWKTIDDVTWEIKLRPGVQFHDGTPLTPDDVLFSLERPATIRNSPSPFTVYTKGIASAQAVDATTIRIRTNGPYPLLPNDLSVVPIVSKRAAANATTEDFNSGKATIGTGPYRFVRWAKGDRIELVRNDAYWGPKAPWERVTLRLIPADPARVAALLTGDVQAIDAVPTADLVKLRTNPDVRLAQVISYRLIYLHLDAARDRSPFITDKAGKPLDRNPLKDVRVRRAISKAINRPLIVDRVMEGAAAQSGQLMADGFFGYTDKLRPEAYDLDGARKLLADAGWPDGFGIVVHGPNDRYVNDERVAQSLAGMLTRAGIQTTVVTMPSSVYFSRANRLEFSLMFLGWGADTGEASSPLKALLATYDAPKGLGTTNRGRYSNAKMDAVLAQALATVDDRKREALLQQATTIAVEDLGIIPLYHQVNIWATRKGLAYTPRTDERTYAFQITPQR
jgi:peptide/nickel transport system substrate-binding protein